MTLLEAIEYFGFGSWQRIKEYLVRPKGEPVEVLIKHYYCVYGENGWLSKTNQVKQLKQQSLRQANLQESTDLDSQILQYFKQNNVATDIQQQFTRQTLNIMRYPHAVKLPHSVNYDVLPKETGEGTGQVYQRNLWPKRFEAAYEMANKAEYPIMFLSVKEGEETRESMNAKI